MERARKRVASEQARIRAGNDADTRDEKGEIARKPSDGDLIPPVSNETPFPRRWNRVGIPEEREIRGGPVPSQILPSVRRALYLGRIPDAF